MEGVFFSPLTMTHLYTHPMEPGPSTAWGLKSVRTRRVKHRVHADSTGHLRLLGIWARCLLGSVFQAVRTIMQVPQLAVYLSDVVDF